MKTDTYLCPGCDKEVAVGSRACPYCNPPQKARKRPKPVASRSKSSWHQESTAEGLHLPDEDFDYDDFVAREFGRKPHRRIGIKWYWWLTALILLVLIIMGIASLGDW
ncbi:MAG: hypothetical protein B9S38_14150 [Verrucomicrobiia bacterium Tous-C4TDCM]|nr:MAG: hypothetical protein B9S38_14150 [Verrucomicrobiae bacterium Tous-C4TDCM]